MSAGESRNEVKAVVRWESAKPIREAVRRQLPPDLANNYIVSVTGLRLAVLGGSEQHEGGKSLGDRLKESTQLERKGADPIAPARVEAGQSGQTPILYFMFPHGSQPIQASDKEVLFHMKAGRLEVKAKFALKEMMYNGELAV
jgi:hypothetical protein